MLRTRLNAPLKVDAFFKGVGYGSVANMLLNEGMKINALRRATTKKNGQPSAFHTNATLRYDEWKHYDMAVIKAALQRLVGVKDITDLGLIYDLGSDGLGTTVLQYEDQSAMSAAELSMDGATRGHGDRIEYSIKYLPLPIIHKDFFINARILSASRKHGTPLDTAQAELAARMVSEFQEDVLFNGYSSYSFGGGTIYGLTDVPTRNTGLLTADWNTLGNAGGATGISIVNDVLAMKQANINARHFGPFGLYVPTPYETPLGEDYKQFGTVSIRERLLEIENIEFIHVADKLLTSPTVANNQCVLVQLTTDTIRLVQGMPITTVEWQSQGQMLFHFKVMAILVPQIRADQNSRSGIAHFVV